MNKVLQKMMEMECESAKHPNKLETYEVLWKKLKQELQFCELGK